MTQPTLIIALILGILANNAMLFFGGAYLYFRGKSGASPLPKIVDRFLNPPPNPQPPETPDPPSISCLACGERKGWDISQNNAIWICRACKREMPGPKPRIRS